MIRKLFFAVITLIIYQFSFAQTGPKIINYDYASGTFDREYLYFKRNFVLKGDAKFNNWVNDSVRVYIFKTRQDDPDRINKVL